ncbi:MAG: response regulator [Spirochaetota bacterium]
MNKSVYAYMGNAKKPVLIVEDKKPNQELVMSICKQINIEHDICENGREALDKVRQREYCVYVVDLMMPVMDGTEFIRELKKIYPNAVIIVQTALDKPETIISLMKQGVYDYIIKPIDPSFFQETLLKAIEYDYLKRMEEQLSFSAGEKIRAQIDWLNYKESRRLSSKDTTETKSIYNVKTSLAQGAGFGTLITLVDIMKSSAEETEDGKLKVDKEIVDMMISNNDYCRTQIDGLNFATKIMERDFKFESYTTSQLINDLPRMLDNVIRYLPEKNLKLTLPEAKTKNELRYNKKAISLVIEEIAVNAFKYAKRNSTINIFTHVNEGYFWFSVKNVVDREPYGGVPPEYEKLVLEPFFRIHPPDETVSKIERIGFGLGLAVADYVSKKHGGIFFIHDVTDMASSKIEPCVLAELLLPIYS